MSDGQIGRSMFFFHLSDEANALAGYRSYDFLLLPAVADRFSHSIDAGCQSRIGHDPAGPDRRDEIVLGYHAIAVLQEINQDIEDLRFDRDRAAFARQLATVRVEGDAFEKEQQIPPLLRLVASTARRRLDEK